MRSTFAHLDEARVSCFNSPTYEPERDSNNVLLMQSYEYRGEDIGTVSGPDRSDDKWTANYSETGGEVGPRAVESDLRARRVATPL